MRFINRYMYIALSDCANNVIRGYD